MVSLGRVNTAGDRPGMWGGDKTEVGSPNYFETAIRGAIAKNSRKYLTYWVSRQ